MRECVCQACRQTVALGESLSVFGRNLCLDCADAALARAGEVSQADVFQNVDPTVCCNCGTDANDRELPELLKLPTCETCIAFYRNRPFPGWIKLSALGLFLLVVFALLYNARFTLAYLELRQMGTALDAGEIDRASTLAKSAAERVPEVDELQSLVALFDAIALLQDDKPRDALQKLRKCEGKLSNDWPTDLLKTQALLAIAFDDGDYDEFLSLAEKTSRKSPGDPMAIASVASAYACKYAETGEEEFREKSLERLAAARKLDSSESMLEYEMRIRHRLHSREIIEREEFQQRYPDGWQAEDKE